MERHSHGKILPKSRQHRNKRRTLLEPIFHEVLAFTCLLQAEAQTAFVLDYVFKDVCVENSFGRQEQYLSLKRRPGLFLLSSIIKTMTLSKAKVRQVCLEANVKNPVPRSWCFAFPVSNVTLSAYRHY